MPIPQGFELIIIAVVALILFGGTKLAGFGKNAGRAIREFKEESKMLDDSKANGSTAAGASAVDADPVRREVLDAEIVDERKPGHQA